MNNRITNSNSHKPNKALQAKLRQMIDESSLTATATRMGMGREILGRYLAGLPMHTTTFRGIETIVAEVTGAEKAGGE